jgi:hypothetical protein
MRAVALALALCALAGSARAFDLASPDLKPDAPIAAAYVHARCGGQNLSPALAWTAPPAGAASLVLTVIDVDAKPSFWSHWIVVGLPAAAGSLSRGQAPPAPAHVAANNFGDAAYGGPCPPVGSGVHHYQFTVWAMPATPVSIGDNAPANEVLSMLKSTSLAHATVVGTAQR